MSALFPLLRVTSLIMISWLAWWLVFAGWGMLFLRACGRRVRGAESLIGAFWIGWSLTLPFLTVWHFFRRVDGAAALVVIAIGLTGHILVLLRNNTGSAGVHARSSLGLRTASSAPRCRPPSRLISLFAVEARLQPFSFSWGRISFILVFLALAFLVADHSLMSPLNFDTGLYHLQAMRWIESYAVVPGLGNLHGRLAFNQSYFLYAALLDAGPWHGLAHYWVTGLFPLTLIAQLLLKLTGRSRRGENPTRRLFWLLLAVPVYSQVNNYNLSSPSPDLPVFILSVVLALELLDLLMLSPAATRTVPHRVLKIVLIALAGITVKFNFVALGGLASALALGVGAARLLRRHKRPAVRRLLLAFSLCGAAFLIPWAARDLVLSGYVGYPLPWFTLPLRWRIPLPAVLEEKDVIYGFARDPCESLKSIWPLQSWSWFPDWATYVATYQKFDILLPLGLVGVALVVALWQRRRGVAPAARPMGLFMVFPIGALVFWFVTAPHPRFAGGAFWILAAGANAFILARFAPRRPRLMAVLAGAMILLSLRYAPRPMIILAPGPERGFHPTPQVRAVSYVTASGLRVLIPASGWQCWDLPLPCTGYPKRGLSLIEPGNLQAGFKLEGTLHERSS